MFSHCRFSTTLLLLLLTTAIVIFSASCCFVAARATADANDGLSSSSSSVIHCGSGSHPNLSRDKLEDDERAVLLLDADYIMSGAAVTARVSVNRAVLRFVAAAQQQKQKQKQKQKARSNNQNGETEADDIADDPAALIDAYNNTVLQICLRAVSLRLPATSSVVVTGATCASHPVSVATILRELAEDRANNKEHLECDDHHRRGGDDEDFIRRGQAGVGDRVAPSTAFCGGRERFDASINVGDFFVDAASTVKDIKFSVFVLRDGSLDSTMSMFENRPIKHQYSTIVANSTRTAGNNPKFSHYDTNKSNNNDDDDDDDSAPSSFLLGECYVPIQHAWRRTDPKYIPELWRNRVYKVDLDPHKTEVWKLNVPALQQKNLEEEGQRGKKKKKSFVPKTKKKGDDSVIVPWHFQISGLVGEAENTRAANCVHFCLYPDGGLPNDPPFVKLGEEKRLAKYNIFCSRTPSELTRPVFFNGSSETAGAIGAHDTGGYHPEDEDAPAAQQGNRLLYAAIWSSCDEKVQIRVTFSNRVTASGADIYDDAEDAHTKKKLNADDWGNLLEVLGAILEVLGAFLG